MSESTECNSFEETYYQRNRDMIRNRAKDYYKSDKKRLRRQARNKYRSLSEGEKTKRKNMEKTDTIKCLKKRKKLKEYQKNYLKAKKYLSSNQ